jgi:hypothetical protein
MIGSYFIQSLIHPSVENLLYARHGGQCWGVEEGRETVFVLQKL